MEMLAITAAGEVAGTAAGASLGALGAAEAGAGLGAAGLGAAGLGLGAGEMLGGLGASMGGGISALGGMVPGAAVAELTPYGALSQIPTEFVGASIPPPAAPYVPGGEYMYTMGDAAMPAEVTTSVSQPSALMNEYEIGQAQGLDMGERVSGAQYYKPTGPLDTFAPGSADLGGAVASPKVPGSNLGITSLLSKMGKWVEQNPKTAAAMGIGGGLLAGSMLRGGQSGLTPYQPKTAKEYGLDRTLAANYQPWRPKMFAAGGIANSNGPQTDYMGGDMFPMSQQQAPAYAVPFQMPTSAQQALASYEPKTNPLTGQPTTHMASGGIAELAVGGKLLHGDGDGMSDSIRANIDGKQEARLASNEFIIPADVVSHLGNGSTDAGAKQLYKMMDRVRTARTGKKKQAPAIKADKYMPA